jgi:hypothetical protein
MPREKKSSPQKPNAWKYLLMMAAISVAAALFLMTR